MKPLYQKGWHDDRTDGVTVEVAKDGREDYSEEWPFAVC